MDSMRVPCPWLSMLVVMAIALMSEPPGVVVVVVVGQVQGPRTIPLTPLDFCGRTLAARSSCLTPPTVENFDISTLVGTYYEVGSTASYKLRYELGFACPHTNFTALDNPNNVDPSSSDDNPPFFQDPDTGGGTNPAPNSLLVQSSAVPVLFNRRTLSALSRISASSSEVCTTTARLCFLMSTDQSRLSGALVRISTVADQIRQSMPYDYATLTQSSAIINSSILTVHARLDGVARAINTISSIAAGLSQAVSTGSAAEALVNSIRYNVAAGSEQAQQFGSVAINNLTYVSAMLAQVSGHLGNTLDVQDASNAEELLRESVTFIGEVIDSISNQVSSLQGQLSSIGGPVADMLEADYRQTIVNIPAANGGRNGVQRGRPRASAAVNPLNGTYTHPIRVTISSGTATQAPNERGTLEIRSSSQNLVEQSYRVIAAETVSSGMISRAGTGQYSAVLLYACQEDDPVNELILLSSTPNIMPQTVVNLLATAASRGVYTDCNTAFVPTVQRPDNCGAPIASTSTATSIPSAPPSAATSSVHNLPASAPSTD